MPAQAGIQTLLDLLGSRLRGNDENLVFPNLLDQVVAHAPSIGSKPPLILAAPSPHRKTPSAATSAGMMGRRLGWRMSTNSRIACSRVCFFSAIWRAIWPSACGVSTQPGAIALHVTPVVAHSSATARVSPTIAAFVVM